MEVRTAAVLVVPRRFWNPVFFGVWPKFFKGKGVILRFFSKSVLDVDFGFVRLFSSFLCFLSFSKVSRVSKKCFPAFPSYVYSLSLGSFLRCFGCCSEGGEVTQSISWFCLSRVL